MDRARARGAALAAAGALLALLAPTARAERLRWPAWPGRLQARLAQLEAEADGLLAVYVKDLRTGADASYRAEETCYLASGVKLAVAVELLRQAAEGCLSLDDTVRIEASDLIDGSPRTGRRGPGSVVSLRELLEDMLVASDNAASDLLIRKVGLDEVNATFERLVPGGRCEITTLADVRRHVYSEIHPEAFRLTSRQIFELDSVDDDAARLRRLAEMLGVPPSQARVGSLDDAFAAYYRTGLNSATLVAEARLLEEIVEGRALDAASTSLLVDLLLRVETGRARVRAGLPATIEWAHKTGTQRQRVADFGVAWPADRPERKVVIAVVASGFASRPEAEELLRRVGQAVHASGIFEETP